MKYGPNPGVDFTRNLRYFDFAMEIPATMSTFPLARQRKEKEKKAYEKEKC